MTLTPAQLKTLRAIASGDCPTVVPRQLSVLLRGKLIVKGNPKAPSGKRVVAVTQEGWDALGIPAPTDANERCYRIPCLSG